jgi:hypothetical protein
VRDAERTNGHRGAGRALRQGLETVPCTRPGVGEQAGQYLYGEAVGFQTRACFLNGNRRQTAMSSIFCSRTTGDVRREEMEPGTSSGTSFSPHVKFEGGER